MIDKLKNYSICVLLVLFITAVISIGSLRKTNDILSKNIENTSTNLKAYINENSTLKSSNQEFQFTIEQLNYINDSIVESLRKVKDELKIKDKNLRRLEYLESTATKTDTVYSRDTIFRDKIALDTIIGDDWYKCEIGLYYPNKVIITPKFISQKYIITSSRKETINPPKKLWICRIFQKKHTILNVEVIEKNPYIENNKQRFINILN